MNNNEASPKLVRYVNNAGRVVLHVEGCSALKRHVHTNCILPVKSEDGATIFVHKVCPKCLPNGRPA